MSEIVFDIETGPLPEDQLKAMCPTFDPDAVKLGNTKDPDKVKAKIEEAEAGHFTKFLNKAALDPQTGYCLVIGWAINDEPSETMVFDEAVDGEVTLLRHFNYLVEQSIPNRDLLIGYGIKNFDLPFLIRRMWINGIAPSKALKSHYRGRFAWSEYVADVYEEWMLGQRPFDKEGSAVSNGLDQVSQSVLGLGKAGHLGKHFSDHFLEDRKTALEYCLTDVERTRDLYRIMRG